MRAERVAENKTLVWSGEHWIAYLKNHDNQADVGRVSLYRVTYSAAGEGHVALVDIPDETFAGIYTDNVKLADFITKTVARGTSNNNFYRHDLPIVEAEITRGGDVRTTPSWTIDAEGSAVETVWSSIHQPMILEGPGPANGGAAVTHSLLFFANEATISLNGKSIGGVVYVRDEWIRAIGRQGTSAVFAIAETTTTTEPSK